jgi:hypothetical protein
MKTKNRKSKIEEQKTEMVLRCAALAARIPFRMLSHMSGTKVHSGRYTNDVLGIGYEYHHPGERKAAAAGFYVPSKRAKVIRAFYRETPPDAPCHDTLEELLMADEGLRRRAERAYPDKEGQG